MAEGKKGFGAGIRKIIEEGKHIKEGSEVEYVGGFPDVTIEPGYCIKGLLYTTKKGVQMTSPNGKEEIFTIPYESIIEATVKRDRTTWDATIMGHHIGKMMGKNWSSLAAYSARQLIGNYLIIYVQGINPATKRKKKLPVKFAIRRLIASSVEEGQKFADKVNNIINKQITLTTVSR